MIIFSYVCTSTMKKQLDVVLKTKRMSHRQAMNAISGGALSICALQWVPALSFEFKLVVVTCDELCAKFFTGDVPDEFHTIY